MACEHQIDFYIGQPVVNVFAYLSKLAQIDKFKVDYVDYPNYRMHLSSGPSLKSWGEDITISFFDPMNGGTRIIVYSKPKLPTTLVDYGKNKKNVEEIVQYISSLYQIR